MSSPGNRAIDAMVELSAPEIAKPITYAVMRAAAALCLAGVRKMPELSIDPRAFKALCREASDIEFAEHVEILTCIGRVRVRPAP